MRRGVQRGRTVTLYTRADCGLCQEAAAVLLRIREKVHFQLTVVDIEAADPAIFNRYWDRVPVVAVDGREIAAAPLDERHLSKILTS